jgi:hypothetical protein
MTNLDSKSTNLTRFPPRCHDLDAQVHDVMLPNRDL